MGKESLMNRLPGHSGVGTVTQARGLLQRRREPTDHDGSDAGRDRSLLALRTGVKEHAALLRNQVLDSTHLRQEADCAGGAPPLTSIHLRGRGQEQTSADSLRQPCRRRDMREPRSTSGKQGEIHTHTSVANVSGLLVLMAPGHHGPPVMHSIASTLGTKTNKKPNQ